MSPQLVHGLSTGCGELGDKVVDKGVGPWLVGNYTENVGQSGEKWGNSNDVPNAHSPPSEAAVFLGEFQHSIDSKGRIAIPARFRSKIERGAVLTRGVETCLFVYTLETWEQKARELDA